jgi:hypothetical protein
MYTLVLTTVVVAHAMSLAGPNLALAPSTAASSIAIPGFSDQASCTTAATTITGATKPEREILVGRYCIEVK